MAGSSKAYTGKLAQLERISTERELTKRWREKAKALLTKLKNDVANLSLGTSDLLDLLEVLFTNEEFPEADEIQVIFEIELFELNATHLIHAEIAGGDNKKWIVTVWCVGRKILILMKF